MRKRVIVGGALVVLIIGLSLADQQNEADVVVRGRQELHYTTLSKTVNGLLWKDFQDKDYCFLPDFALMSTYVYDGVGSTPIRPVDLTGTTNSSEQQLQGHWKPLRPVPAFPPTPPNARHIAGLMYDVWVSNTVAMPRIAVIVFRGTDPTEVGDWFSNARWITRFIPNTWDQYEQVLALTPPLVTAIHNAYGLDCRIFTTGHSLGGGLAQQAAYASPAISKVFAFDPSTVTGYYSIPKEVRPIYARGKRVYRIYEKGEVLSIIRAGMKTLYPLSRHDPHIIEVRYNLMNGNMINEHNMAEFATCLRQCAAHTGLGTVAKQH